jgi:tetratricopeptide (TPR) repeat protein
MGIPPDFAADIQRVQQLEEQRQRDPRAILPLIQVYKRMLERLRPNDGPPFYAALQNNLGKAYGDLPTGDRAANLEQAIRCYQQASCFLTPEMAPLEYAMTQHNLGNAYQSLPTGDRASNLAQAISYYQQALRFYTPEAEPFECRRTTRDLADLYFAQGAWDAALRAYRVAMHVGEQIYRVGLSTTSKAAEVSESVALYPYAAFAAVRCGEVGEALLILERGKTRLLTEALAFACSPSASGS